MTQVVIEHDHLGFVSLRQLSVLAANPTGEYFRFASAVQRDVFLEAISVGDEETVYGLLGMCGQGFAIIDDEQLEDG